MFAVTSSDRVIGTFGGMENTPGSSAKRFLPGIYVNLCIVYIYSSKGMVGRV